MNENPRWYYAVEDETHGPVGVPELERLIREGVVVPSAWIAAEGTEDWVLAQNSAFSHHFTEEAPEQMPTRTAADEFSSADSPERDKPVGMDASNHSVQKVVAALLHTTVLFRRHWRVTVPGIFVLGCMTLVLHHYRHWHFADRHEPAATTQSTRGLTTSNLEPWNPTPHTLVIKGLYIGMSAEEATKNIVVSGHGRIWTRPSTFGSRESQKGYDIVFNEENDPKGRWTGQIWIDPNTERVTVFFFDKELTDFLFKTADQSAKEFAQSLIDSYGVPNLSPSEFSGRQAWMYKSPQGWTLRIMADKTVDVSKTPERSFD